MWLVRESIVNGLITGLYKTKTGLRSRNKTGLCKTKTGLSKTNDWLSKISNFQILALSTQIQNLAHDKGISQNYLDGSEELVNSNKYLSYTPALSKEDVEERVKNFKDYCSLENVKVRIKSINKSVIEIGNKALERLIENKKIVPYYLSGRDFIHLFEQPTIESIVISSALELRSLGFTEDEIKKYVDSVTEDNVKKHTDSFNETVLKIRNETWLEKLVSTHQLEANKEMFVATGLKHFVGYHNILDMLKNEGFTVKRYSAKCVAEESH